MAEREGFEPSIQVLAVYSLSRRAPSANSAISPHHFGGGGGIRTHGTRKGSTVFKTASFNRSDTPPRRRIHCFSKCKSKYSTGPWFLSIILGLINLLLNELQSPHIWPQYFRDNYRAVRLLVILQYSRNSSPHRYP